VDPPLVECEIERCLAEYRRLMDGRGDALQTLSALARYGEAAQWLALLPGTQCDRWQNRLPPMPSDQSLSAAIRGLSERLGQSRHTLSCGERFEYEELLLLLTHAIDIELVHHLLRGDDLTADVLAGLELDFAQIRTSKENERAYEEATAQLRRTYRLPSRFLSSRS
jgi:hypothetical protein